MKLWQRKQEDEEQTLQEQVSVEEERLRSKKLYKIYLLSIKYSPIIILIVEILFSILAYLTFPTTWLSYIACVSFLYLFQLYVASYVFRFCYLYRLSLHSIVITNTLAIIDTSIKIPLSDLNMLRLYLIISLIGIILFILFKYKEHKKSRPSN